MAITEVTFDAPIKRGARGLKAKRIQEWLSLSGISVATDGDFGPATEAGVKVFQKQTGLTQTGTVDKATFEALVRPISAALAPLPAGRHTLGSLAVAYAQQHLAQHPREVGGQNCGPWVRLYMDGNEGQVWAWCAGFACFVLKQSCDTLRLPMPFTKSFSCDSVAGSARQKGIFLKEPPRSGRAAITPGSLFLVRRTPDDWTHVGFVVKAEAEVFHTIEGNTNDSGSREGFEVCARIRGYGSKDFVLIA
ncbi:MAG: peptidoglycan-binding protein [Bryobacterales bacterium]|nr:peptidoglycan-binding protein [Bryobacterales bacterium]